MPSAMLERPTIDKKLLQGLYLQGYTPKEIERKTGVKARTVTHYAVLGRWTTCKQSADSLLAEIPFEQRAAKLKTDQLQVVEGYTDVLLDNPPTTIAELNKQALSAKTVIELSSKLCNWDSERPASLIQINLLSQPYEKVMEGVDNEGVIDVASNSSAGDNDK